MTSSGLATTSTFTTALCTTTLLPSNGVLSISGSPATILTLGSDVVFRAPCPTAAVPTVSVSVSATASSASLGSAQSHSDGSLNLSTSDDDNGDPGDGGPHFSDFRDPFFASSFPICYALAATTVTAYMLVIMLFITPQSFVDSGRMYLGHHGRFPNGSSRNVNSIGRRPWLQKVAALTVAISLTIATADTFKIAKEQYIWGVQNAKVLQNEVMGSTELKAIRLISDTFLWSAQAQTLIRLFPRQREKIIITWAAVALISLDVIFSALNSFIYTDPGSIGRAVPKGFTHPIPALGYLFQLSLGVLYAAWVIYYSLMKKRYAFYHPLMRNISLVAIMSLTAIMIPVVFFILDISKPEFTGWGDYVRWVGAAAASVVVWEWLERIEALEREEKKDGILGREVFDGDDTLQVTASEQPWPQNRKGRRGGGGGGGGGGGEGVGGQDDHGQAADGRRESFLMTASDPGSSGHAIVGHRNWSANQRQSRDLGEDGDRSMGNFSQPAGWLPRPAPAMTPASRGDTTSAGSTVHQARHQGGPDAAAAAAAARTADPPSDLHHTSDSSGQTKVSQPSSGAEGPPPNNCHSPSSNPPSGHVVFHVPLHSIDMDQAACGEPSSGHWQTIVPAVNHAVGRRGSEAWSTLQPSEPSTRTIRPRASTESRSRWDIRARLEDFAATQAEKMRERLQPTADTNSLPVTVIPAPARRGAALQQVLEEEELGSSVVSAIRRARRQSGGSDESSISGGSDLDRSEGRGRSHPGLGSRVPERNIGGAGQPFSDTSPPLWPGVGRQQLVYDDDDGDGGADSDGSFEGSITESLSVVSRGHERDPEHDGDMDPDPQTLPLSRPPGH